MHAGMLVELEQARDVVIRASLRYAAVPFTRPPLSGEQFTLLHRVLDEACREYVSVLDALQ